MGDAHFFGFSSDMFVTVVLFIPSITKGLGWVFPGSLPTSCRYEFVQFTVSRVIASHGKTRTPPKQK